MELVEKIINLVKERKKITVSEVIALLELEDTRTTRDKIRKMFFSIAENEKFIKIKNERGAYVLVFDEDEYSRFLELKQREELIKQKDTIIEDFLKFIIVEKTKRIIKYYVVENDSIIEKEKEEIRYYADIRYYSLLKKLEDYRVKDISIIKYKDIFILLKEDYDRFIKDKIKKAYILHKSDNEILFELLKDYLVNNKLDYATLYNIAKVIDFTNILEKEEKKEDINELEDLKTFLEVE